MSERVMADWNVTLHCDCPHCGEFVDLLDYIDFWDGGGPGVCNNGDDLEIPCTE